LKVDFDFASVECSIHEKPMEPLYELQISSWSPQVGQETCSQAMQALERGQVLLLPRLAFEVTAQERRFLSPEWSDGRAKNLNFEEATDMLKGAKGSSQDLQGLREMIKRFSRQAKSLIATLLPAYSPFLTQARTSFRPLRIEGRITSAKKDDQRLHVVAFPCRPNQGERILRVFTNVYPHGEPRVWRVGEPFEEMACRFVSSIHRPLPGSASVLHLLRITKGKRSLYDHYMLHLHDELKADSDYQQHAPQYKIPFPAGSTWLMFSDQVLHAAMSGQYLFEQTFHLPVAALSEPTTAPLRVLERLTGRALI
jgi:hypothetical protein